MYTYSGFHRVPCRIQRDIVCWDFPREPHCSDGVSSPDPVCTFSSAARRQMTDNYARQAKASLLACMLIQGNGRKGKQRGNSARRLELAHTAPHSHTTEH